MVPPDRHTAAGQEAWPTAHVERSWYTAQQRRARLVRKTLSCSNCERNRLGARWHFIRLDNTSRR